MPSNTITNYTFLHCLILSSATVLLANAADIYLDWNVALNNNITPLPSSNQSVITINGRFPGPLINATTNDVVHVNVHNFMDEPLLFTWNGIQQRLNSWQDGVSGTNCPIQPDTNWTYQFQIKDQVGTFFYFPSLNFQKAAGGYGPIRVNNRNSVPIPFAKPEAEFDLLIGDWFLQDYKELRSVIGSADGLFTILMNGKMPYGDPASSDYASFTVVKSKTYMLRISNVGNGWSFNLRIQNHKMVLVETEGSYTKQMTLESLDVHIGQSYSVLVTADQQDADFYIMASPKMFHSLGVFGLGVLHYSNSNSNVTGSLPKGPDPFDISSSITLARSIKWNLTTGAARPNPQGSFNVAHVTPTQTFILISSTAEINNVPRYVVNNVSYDSMEDTPLKLVDYFGNITGDLKLDSFPVQSINNNASIDTFVVSGTHKGWIELVFKNDLDDVIDSWHLDGFSFFVVGFGTGDWTYESRSSYNLVDPVVRSTTQVYPKGWTVVYAYLDNPGIWNLRSQRLQNWYLGQELYIRVHDDNPNPAKEKPPPKNLLLCGKLANHVHEPIVHEHEIRKVAAAPVAAPIPSPAAHETSYWIGTRPAPSWIVTPRNAPPPSPGQTSLNFEITTKESDRDLLRTRVGLESRTTIAATMSFSTIAPTPSPIPSASAAVKTNENVADYHIQPIISPPMQRSIPAPTSRAPAPSPIPFVSSEQRASADNVADYHSRRMNSSPTQAPAPVPISRSTALPSSPTPSFPGSRTLAHAFPPSSEAPSPAQTSLNIDIGAKKVERDLLRTRVGLESRTTIAATMSPSTVAPTSGAPTPSPIPSASAAMKNMVNYHHHLQRIISPPTQRSLPVPTSRAPAPSPTPFVSAEQRASTGSVAMNAWTTQAPAPVPSSPTPSFSGKRTLAHAFPPSSKTPSPTPSASRAREAIDETISDHHFHSTIQAPAPSPTPSVSGEQRASTENVAMNASPTQAPAPVPSSPTPSFSGKRILAHAFPPSSETPPPTPSASRARGAHFHSTIGPQAPAPTSDPRAPAPSSGAQTIFTEKLVQYHPKPILNNGETEPLARAPYAPIPTPVVAPVPAPTPVVAATHGSTWARWWWT